MMIDPEAPPTVLSMPETLIVACPPLSISCQVAELVQSRWTPSL
jgi:hypothetical protein